MGLWGMWCFSPLLLIPGTLKPGIVASDMALSIGGARSVMVIVVGNGHGDTSSNPGLD